MRRPKHLIGYLVRPTDGFLGEVQDFLFDDRTGQIRHLVIRIAERGRNRDLLISPECIRFIHPEGEEIFLTLSRAELLGSPSIDTDPPVWRQKGPRWYYFLPVYPWPSMGGAQVQLPIIAASPGLECGDDTAEGDPHLRSVDEVATYVIRGTDGKAGFVRGFLMDTKRWVIDSIVVRTRTWLPVGEVLLPWTAVQEVDYDKEEVRVDRTRNEVRNSPRYDPRAEGPDTPGVGVCGLWRKRADGRCQASDNCGRNGETGGACS